MSEKRTHVPNLGALRTLPEFVRLLWRSDRRLVVASVSLRAARALLPVGMLFVAKLIIDQVVKITVSNPPHRPTSLVQSPIGLLLLLEFTLAVASDMSGRMIDLIDTVLADKFSDETSLLLMSHAATLDLQHFEDSDVQDQLDRARRQASGRTGMIRQMFGLAQDGVTLIGFAASIAVYAPWLIVLLVATLVPAFLGELRFNSESYLIASRRTSDRRELDYLRQVGASSGMAKEVKLFGLHGFLLERYRRIAADIRLESMRFSRRRAVAGTGLATMGTAGYYAAYAYLAWLAVNGTLSVGDLTFLAASFLRLRGLIAGLLSGASTLAGQALYARDLFDFLALVPQISSPEGGRSFPTRLEVGISFENVGFRYPGSGRWAVRHLSFDAPAAGVVALVGENGAGKTTIAKLLTRLYDPDEGRITVDGVDLRDYDLGALRAGFGVIFQDFIRYDLSAGENIAVGRIDAREDRLRILAAAELSKADEVIDRLPSGLEHRVGRRFAGGVELSGGEWQKLAIARSYMREAAVLILDEPTAALDARAEYEVFRRFAALCAGRTAFLISHRFSSVRNADMIIVLSDGRVAEQGSHQQLLEMRGRYAGMFELQASGYR